MKITEKFIPLIEKALGFELYEWQRAYLLEEPHSIPNERATGRTTVYIVKLLLTNREPIDIKFDAMKYKDHRGVEYTRFFRSFMREIDEKLTAVGLPTCTVKPNSSNRTIEIEVDADTSKLQLKLRAIAKHAGALADDLEAIDNSWVCECGSTDYEDAILRDVVDKVVMHQRECSVCHKVVSIVDSRMPTQSKVSD